MGLRWHGAITSRQLRSHPLLEIGNAAAKIQGRTGGFMARRMLRLKLPDTRAHRKTEEDTYGCSVSEKRMQRMG